MLDKNTPEALLDKNAILKTLKPKENGLQITTLNSTKKTVDLD